MVIGLLVVAALVAGFLIIRNNSRKRLAGAGSPENSDLSLSRRA